MKQYIANLMGDRVVSYATDRGAVPVDTSNADYRELLAAVARGEVELVVPEPVPPELSRDDRLLAAVEKANAGVDAALDTSADFTARQKAVLKAILKGAFSSLGKAVSGEQP